MDARLSPLMYSWPEKHQLWHTMAVCFKYSFGIKVTVISDCSEVNFKMLLCWMFTAVGFA